MLSLVARRLLLAAGGAFVLVLGLVAPAAVAAQGAGPVDPRLLAALRWRNLGPFRGGRVSAVTGVSGQPGTFYVGTPGGGVWKSTSAGTTWTPVFDAVRAVSSIGAVEVAPSNPDVVYVGTGDMISGGTLDQGNGLYKSTDAGRSWQHLGLEGTRHIQTILVDPRSADVLLVGALGDHVTASDQRGVFRSTDGGRSFTRTLFVDDQTGIAKLARAFDVPDVVFATTMRHYGGPTWAVGSYRTWQFSIRSGDADSSRTYAALYKSRDGGITWAPVTGGGLPRLEGRMSVAVAPGTNAQRVYLITNAALWRSDDGGANWRQMAADDERIRNGQGGYSCGVYVDPKNPDVVYTLNTAAYKSTDGGRTFTGWKGAPGGDDPQNLWIDPADGRRILMGLDQGATVTLDGGGAWTSWYNQSTEQLYHLSADNSYPAWIYATQQDAGAIRTRIRGNFGAITPFDWNPVNGWEWGTIVPDPRDASVVMASGNGLVRIRYPSEQWINVSPAIDPSTPVRTTSDQPLAWTPWTPRQLLLGLDYVAASPDHGDHWSRRSPNLGVPAGMDSATANKTLGGRGAIESLSASPAAKGLIWVGTNNGLIHLTRDGGRTWKDVSIAGLASPRRANITSIEASPFAPGTAYAAVEYLRIGDHAPYIFRTRDFGASWTRIVTGLPADEPSGSFVRVVRPDPKKAGLLFAGTESGAYVSFDEGDHWQSLGTTLPNTPVRDLLVKDNDLIVATHGRGLWALDDISMLRQLTPSSPSAAVQLFAPGAAVRVRRNVGWNTPLPPEIPHAANPLEGAIIDYWLGADAPAGVTIDVLDARGAVVRRLTHVATPPVAEAAHPPHPDFWIAPATPLPTGAGMHRVHWDLRRDAPAAFTHSFEINANPGLTPPSPEGALVPPGRYTLRLTANGAVVTQPVEVRPDPRSPATVAAIAAQYALQLQLADALQASYAAAEQVAGLRKALAHAEEGTPGAEVVQAVAAMRAVLDSVTGPSAGGGRRRAGGAPVPVRGRNDTFAGPRNAP
ncbi:MAG: hypothetical protein HY275_13270, partial [Gemmatimonadetes bacterium]|nr:hypothetical protein [Gemmatimonadota bacterium]